jgi:phosphoglycolate phosphatase
MGAALSRPAVTVLVTDMDNTLFEDVAMAQTAGVIDVFARYGDVRNRPGYPLLRRVTHWSPTMLAGSERLTEAEILPTHVLGNGYAELLGLIDFRRFVPRRPV